MYVKKYYKEIINTQRKELFTTMRLSDYVMSYLEQLQIDNIFMLSGGGIMYLVDALGRSRIHHVCCHHEQAAAIAAQSYAMKRNGLGVCLVTTGPGGTNALTATGASYVDSTPVLFLSGQVKRADFASKRHVRQFGAQENDIVSMAKPVTKYAVCVTDATEIKYHLQKAIYLATHGRQGPVWLDIPLDIQNAEIEPEQLCGFTPDKISEPDILAERQPDLEMLHKVVYHTVTLLQKAKRPLFLIGHGVVASRAEDLFLQVQRRLKIPVVATWRALHVMDSDDSYFFGSPGLQACRYSNLITQGADLLIVLGSRLDNMITAFSEEHFACRAQKIIVDIDEAEIMKLDMQNVTPVVCNVKDYLDTLYQTVSNFDMPQYEDWHIFCGDLKKKYPLTEEKQDPPVEGIDLYKMAMEISNHCGENDTVVVSSTSRCNTAGHMAFHHKVNQRVISSMGFGSMGFALPSVIGAWFGSKKNRVVMLEGDGSLQLNLQELQTIVTYCIDAKLFVFHNTGYAAIATMQDRNFDGFHVGCDKESGVEMPDLEKISCAYGIPYYFVKEKEQLVNTVEQVFAQKGPVLCEFFGSLSFDEIPKCISHLDENNNRVSAQLENPYPFLPAEEIDSIYKRMEEI